jgi:hypothetical protein
MPFYAVTTVLACSGRVQSVILPRALLVLVVPARPYMSRAFPVPSPSLWSPFPLRFLPRRAVPVEKQCVPVGIRCFLDRVFLSLVRLGFLCPVTCPLLLPVAFRPACRRAHAYADMAEPRPHVRGRPPRPRLYKGHPSPSRASHQTPPPPSSLPDPSKHHRSLSCLAITTLAAAPVLPDSGESELVSPPLLQLSHPPPLPSHLSSITPSPVARSSTFSGDRSPSPPRALLRLLQSFPAA